MTKTPHFFKAKSRIGLRYPPARRKKLNIGVEDSPDGILTEKFLAEFKNFKTSEYVFPKPENILPKDYNHILAEELNNFKDLINKSLKLNETQIVIGGENSITFPSLLADIERLDDVQDIGYIQFDSHGEMNLESTSPTKNFHGMYMRPFLDKFDIPEIEVLVPNKLSSDQVMFFGDQILDGDEPEFMGRKGLKSVTQKEYLKNKTKVQKNLKSFINSFKHIHINFDIDIFHQNIAPSCGMAGDGAWGLESVLDLLKIISKHPNLSFDLYEVNIKIGGATNTLKVAREVLRKVLSFAI